MMKKRWISALCTTAMVLSMTASMPMTTTSLGRGDLNNDGVLNTFDVREMMKMQLASPTVHQKTVGDYDCNGVFNTSDARALLNATMTSEEDMTTFTNYLDIDSRDWWGEKSIAILGDSITFGAGCSDGIAENSYAGIVKNAIKKANGGKMNYGFMPAYTTNWATATVSRSDEVCKFPDRAGGPGENGKWLEESRGDCLMYFGLTANNLWASLTYHLRDGYNFKYVCAYYQTGPNHGSFVMSNIVNGAGYDQIAVGDTAAITYDCENTVSETKRTKFYRVSDFTEGISIVINSSNNEPVTITGLGFYDDISGEMLTVNKYARGGAMLTPLSDTVLSQAASSDTLIMGLGYNDAYWGMAAHGYTKEQFSNRIDHLIAECNKNGTHVIVNDYLWSNWKDLKEYKNWSASVKADIDEKQVFFRQELQRFARETGGIYINQEAIHGQKLVDTANANDGVHPLDAGHAMMAESILQAMGLK